MRVLLPLWLLGHLLTSDADAPRLSLPPAWEDRVIFYHSFERNDGRTDINTAGLEIVKTMDSSASGVRGRGGAAGQGRGIELRGAALSPHCPLTVSFWWALVEDANKDSGFGLFHLTNGRGFVSHFARSGPWCALEQTSESDQLHHLILGNPHGLPMALDEVVILNRPLTDDEIATYVRAIRQMRSVGYPIAP